MAVVWTGSRNCFGVPHRRTNNREGPTSVGTQSIWRHNQLMTGSRTQMLLWFSCRDWNAVSSQVLGSSTVQTPSHDHAEFIFDTLGYTSSQCSSTCISCVRPRGRTSGCHWPHELPRLTPVGACWWLPLEPRQRQRCSRRRETSQRHAPMTCCSRLFILGARQMCRRWRRW